jgi:hypothetical protein
MLPMRADSSIADHPISISGSGEPMQAKSWIQQLA